MRGKGWAGSGTHSIKLGAHLETIIKTPSTHDISKPKFRLSLKYIEPWLHIS